ncbi:MAG: hypothetical protein LC746_05295 [Acidobacteria bacterium]|nr:hypothetical protein [Acidobacteriota bacterium]
MRSYVSRIAVALLAFANGVACVALLEGSTGHWFGIARGLLVFLALLVPCAISLSQASPGERGLRRLASCNPLTSSLSGLLFTFGAIGLFIILVERLFF